MCDTRVLEVTSVWDCESQYDCVKIVYTKTSPGIPQEIKTEWVYTKTLGDWKRINFLFEDGVTLESFLECMTEKNTEVLQKICLLLLDKINSEHWKYMYLIPILDPTFVPPKINNRCRWQRELADTIVNEHFRGVISTCINKQRLNELAHVLKYQNT